MTTPTTAHLLVVDDDMEIRQLLSDYLQQNGYRVSIAADGTAMQQMLKTANINLIILDIMLPGKDGLDLCRELRATSDIPIIMLTARGDDMDRILGLEMGADDYLPKPFNPRELLARIKGVLRRSGTLPHGHNHEINGNYRFNGWILDTSRRHLLSPTGTAVSLSSAEYRLLLAFVSHANRILSRDQLLDLARDRSSFAFDRSIDMLVSRLRHRLQDDTEQPEMIKTVRGEGYLFLPSVETVT
ncbi:MAG TPA: response regulator [Gammaproteobacteria bacterium]|nr:response regulator [Gammaproteobacteria bacterium]